jgi:hypothetical protein
MKRAGRLLVLNSYNFMAGVRSPATLKKISRDPFKFWADQGCRRAPHFL